VDVLEKVGHLVMGDIEAVELVLKRPTQCSELRLVSHVDTPTNREIVLNLFQFPQEREYFQVVCHYFFSEHSLEG
jgi:hypothetical protein